MNPEHQLMRLLQDHSFDLVRQRKHKVYRSPGGLTFVMASTPSDRRASYKALSNLKRILGAGNRLDFDSQQFAAVESALDIGTAEVMEPLSSTKPSLNPESSVVTEDPPLAEPQRPVIREQWEAWKRQYLYQEKMRAKNDKFLSVIEFYVDRACDLLHNRDDVDRVQITDAVKVILRGLKYKSKVLLHNGTVFDQGIAVASGQNQPILWASNGHIGISAFLFFNAYIQHGPSKQEKLRFDWNGLPVLFELPDKSCRKFHTP